MSDLVEGERRLYLCEITVRAVFNSKASAIGGTERTHDETAAWEAASLTGYLEGNDLWDTMGQCGFVEDAGLTGLIAEVSSLHRIEPGEAIEHRWGQILRAGPANQPEPSSETTR